jgi:hypothetical protein
MCSVVHKTTSELECAILTTFYLASAKNTDKANKEWSCLDEKMMVYR